VNFQMKARIFALEGHNFNISFRYSSKILIKDLSMRMRVEILFTLLLISACQSTMKQKINDQPIAILPFEFLKDTFVVVEPSIGKFGSHRFLLDTGAGFDAISNSLCKKIGCKTHGTLTGKRMRGDEITLALTNVESVEFAGIRKSAWEMGVTNLFDEIPPELGKLDGAISLRFFADQAFTIDFPKKQLVIESMASLKNRVERGTVVDARLYSQLPKTLGVFLSVDAFGETGSFEVDTGNLTTILPQKHLKRLQIDLNSPETKVIRNKQMNRVYSKVEGKVNLSEASEIVQTDPQICFEDIIYDGVIGIDFFKDKVVTFDVPAKRVIFSKR
jgi:hypothetical protein